MASEATTTPRWKQIEGALTNLEKTGREAAWKQSLLYLRSLPDDEETRDEIKDTLQLAQEVYNATLPDGSNARITTVNFFVDVSSDTGTTTKLNVAAVGVLVERMKKRLKTSNFSPLNKKQKQLKRAMANLATETAKGDGANTKKVEALTARIAQLNVQCATYTDQSTELQAAHHAVCAMMGREGWELRKPRREQVESKCEEGTERGSAVDQIESMDLKTTLGILDLTEDAVRLFPKVKIHGASSDCSNFPLGTISFLLTSHKAQDDGSFVIKALVVITHNPAEVGFAVDRLKKWANMVYSGWGEIEDKDGVTVRLVADDSVALVVLTDAMEERHMGLEHQTQWRREATHWLWQMCGGQFASEEQKRTVMNRLQAAAHTTTGEVLACNAAEPHVHIVTRE